MNWWIIYELIHLHKLSKQVMNEIAWYNLAELKYS